MPLDTLEGLPEEVAKLYKKGDDGKFHADIPDVKGLKSALDKERADRSALEKALKDRETAEETAKLEAERKELERKGEYEKLSAQDKARIQELEGRLKQTDTEHQQYVKHSLALSLLGPAAVNAKALEYLASQFEQSLEIVQGKIVVKGSPEKDPKALADEIQKDPLFAPFLRGSGISGPGGNPPAGGGTLTATRTRYDELMNKKEPLTRAESVEIQNLGAELQKEQRKG